VGTHCSQRFVKTEGARFRDAPGMHLLAADAIPKLSLAFEDENARTPLGHGFA
jgi:hypothetical protein